MTVYTMTVNLVKECPNQALICRGKVAMDCITQCQATGRHGHVSHDLHRLTCRRK